jgi:hypothetical protein
MPMKPDFSFSFHDRSSNVEEFCCLFVMGELPRDQRALFEEHLSTCAECRKSVQDFERIALFDLPGAAALRGDALAAHEIEAIDESSILARVKTGASLASQSPEGEIHLAPPLLLPCPIPWWKRLRRILKVAIPIAGWSFAAVLLVLLWPARRVSNAILPANAPIGMQNAPASDPTVDNLRRQLADLEKQRRQDAQKFIDADARARRDSLALARLTEQFQSLGSNYSAAQADLTQSQSKLTQASAELDLTRKRLNDESAARDALQGQLSEIYARFEKQGAEVARLEKVAANVPSRLPALEKEFGNDEAREILGARDLHIVDVYDVDNSGKSSRAYGRVYYVNRTRLVFYAFDLSQLERSRKAVAFQVWGFRQPESKAAESLGLFYMDDASLNRWALRVSDPRLLSRIDTLFVTVEPPGGSHFPKGRRLLMASLAGPPNHP